MREARRSVAVLIVDDEVAIVELICEALGDHGITATGCTVPEAACALARRLAPQLVILDLVMPGMDGFDVLRRLRAAPETATIPVLLITASVKELPEDLAADGQGSVEVLRKPFDLDALLVTVERMVGD